VFDLEFVISKTSAINDRSHDFPDKIELVKEIIANLAHAVLSNAMQRFAHIPVERFLEKEPRQIVG
jgi:hypothetical protein